MRPRDFHRDEGMIIALWQNVVIVSFSSRPEAEHVAQVEAGARELLRTHDSVVLLVRLGEMARPPEKEARDRISGMMNAFADHSDGWALVIEVGGFLGSALRSVAAGMSMMNIGSVVQKPFSSVDEATQWLSERSETSGWTAEQLQAAVAQVGYPGSQAALHH